MDELIINFNIGYFYLESGDLILFKRGMTEFIQYEIGIMFLNKIKEIEKDYLEIDVFDLSVTQLKYPTSTIIKKTKKDGKQIIQTTYIPEMVFNLVNSDKSPVSLIEVLLPHHNILCSNAELLEKDSIKEIKEGKEIFSKMVFNLMVFTKKTLTKTTETYEQYQNELDELKIQNKKDLDELRDSYKSRIDSSLEPYKTNERTLREELAKKDEEINKLLIRIPNQMNKKIREFIEKQQNS